MILFKRLLVTFCVFVAGLLLVIFLGSIDAPSYDDHGLTIEPSTSTIASDENGFSVIAYMAENDYSHFPDEENAFNKIKEILNDSLHQPEKAQELLTSATDPLRDIKKSTEKPHFKTPFPNSALDIINYTPLMEGNRLLLLQAQQHYQQKNIQAAIKLYQTSLIFSQQVKEDESHLLISWAIGTAMLWETVHSIHQFATTTPLTSQQYQQTLTLFQGITPYTQEGLKHSAQGEFQFALALLKNQQTQNIQERLSEAKETGEWYESLQESRLLFSHSNYLIVSALLPRYYAHSNRMLTFHGQNLNQLAEQSNHYCQQVTFEQKEFSWGLAEPSDFFLPNSSLRLMKQGSVDGSYIFRKCFAYTYFEGVKTAIALQAYWLQHQHFPESLEALIPAYLSELPIDYFTGKPLMYAPKKAMLYSTGENFIDNGGSTEGYYQGKCDVDESCRENPSIPITTTQAPSKKQHCPKANEQDS